MSTRTVVAWGWLLLAGGLHAQSVGELTPWEEPVPAPQGLESKDWRVQLGAMVLAGPKAPGAEEGRVIPLPVFTATYQDRWVLGSSRIGVGAGAAVHLVKSSHVVWDIGVGFGERRQEKRVDEWAGMGDRSGSGFAGTALHVKAGIFGAGLTWAKAIGSQAGSRGTISMGFGGPLGGRWLGRVTFSGTWSDAEHMAWEFGVTDQQAAARSQLITAGDPRLHAGEDRAYAPTAGWRDSAITGSLTFLQDAHWRWFGVVRWEALGSQAKASPLVRQPNQGLLGIGFSYAF